MGTYQIELKNDLEKIDSEEALLEMHASLARNSHLKQEIEAKAKQKIADIQSEAERQIAPLNNTISECFSKLFDYAHAYPDTIARDSHKSTKTPSGRIGWRKEKDRVLIKDDEEEVIERLRKYLKDFADSLIVTTERLDLEEIRKNFEMVSGISGIEYKEGTDKFYVDVTNVCFEATTESTAERFVAKT